MKVIEGSMMILLCTVSGACANANLRPLPIASAIIVHGCAAAEADAYIRGNTASHYAVSEVSISLKNSGDHKGSLGLKDWLGLEAVRGAEKGVELKLAKLPTMAQCKAWGYVLQLGENGCLLGSPITTCNVAQRFPADVLVVPGP